MKRDNEELEIQRERDLRSVDPRRKLRSQQPRMAMLEDDQVSLVELGMGLDQFIEPDQ